ncbi:Fur family transcriptional regulator [Leptolyngbya sp. FACHB-261]|uniref:Fur family transcriptional regulator n=1 Tax=Leptolyngbya sp. FACHB-261 TaxID=2692806 RepID=UPI001689C044|nr:transcriptional repressor [Leptolyngbya sp. FACHB-261]MBD2103782.1 transcriptional repressor [Leptolyngbya sp. FACHB-261]
MSTPPNASSSRHPERTRSQKRILSLLKDFKRSLSAQEIYLELRQEGQRIGLATVYRALEALKLEGEIQSRTLTSGEALYDLPHRDEHHLTCLQCGVSVPIDDCPVHELETRLSQNQRFKIYYHTLEFFGLCTDCQPV